MVTDGEFSDAARAAIIEAGHGRCVGCGTTPVTTQHRRARGMGGTSSAVIGHPGNGVPLCGDGTRGCHGWAEHHPTDAALLGWRLVAGEEPTVAPWWDRVYGWRRWTVDGFLVYVDEDEDLDRPLERDAARVRYLARVSPRA